MHLDIMNKLTVQASKMEVYIDVIQQIAAREPVFAPIYRTMVADLREAASIQSNISIASMQQKLYHELKEQSEEFLRRYLNVK